MVCAAALPDHPPLSFPRHRSMPGMTERFELFINKREVGHRDPRGLI